MRRLLILISIVFSSQIVNCQNYVPFPTDFAQWNTLRTWYQGGEWGNFTTWNYKYTMNGDTLLNDILYKKVNYFDGYEFYYYAGGLREDDNKNVYFFPATNYFLNGPRFPSDTTEYLLYSFDSLQVGTVLNINDKNIQILAIDSVLLGEVYHKLNISV